MVYGIYLKRRIEVDWVAHRGVEARVEEITVDADERRQEF